MSDLKDMPDAEFQRRSQKAIAEIHILLMDVMRRNFPDINMPADAVYSILAGGIITHIGNVEIIACRDNGQGVDCLREGIVEAAKTFVGHFRDHTFTCIPQFLGAYALERQQPTGKPN